MSAAHRSLTRLPLDVYTDLIRGRGRGGSSGGDGDDDNVGGVENPEELRRKICLKLKKFPVRMRKSRGNNNRGNGSDVVHESVTTVGQLLTRISKLTLLQVLDPLLTYEECDLFLRRVACTCAPIPDNALDLLNETESLADLVAEGERSATSYSIQQQSSSLLFDRLRYLPTGLPSLDDALKGGLRVGTITELVGRAGAGKTQIAMQVCVMAARHGQGCIYIDTEKKLSLPRLQEIAEKRAAVNSAASSAIPGNNGASQPGDGTNTNNASTTANFSYNQHDSFASAYTLTAQERNSQSGVSSSTNILYRRPKEVLDNITVLSPSTTPELLSALVEVEELILVRNEDAIDVHSNLPGHNTLVGAGDYGTANQQATANTFPVRLLIVDSIAAPTKRGFGSQTAAERAAAVFQCAQRLKQLAHQLRLAVLVINQVVLEQPATRESSMDYTTTSPMATRTSQPLVDTRASPTGSELPLPMEKVFVKAALGTSWHHCVSTRIILEQHQQQQENYNPNNHGSPPTGANASSNLRTARRTATIVKSNVVGLQSTEFQVVGSGVVDASMATTTGASDFTNPC